ncbi:MAG: hypothetical protein IPO09_10700 [Anaeromyxobacter sp.]|nr:hypothetical protein [Anaeromyxobacter sp.]MBL0276724.1 hypothetical protein [Anaeromyxobacter sp.]
MTWTRGELAAFRKLSTPEKIQTWLDGLAYRTAGDAVCPRQVLVERRAHCFDGALFGAAALRRLGHPPALVDLRAVRDDDHVLAVYRVDGCWGAVAKSNFAGLRSREPIHRTLRELVLSYFEAYFNLKGQKTLRQFSPPLSLRQFDRLGWEHRDAPLPLLSERLDGLRHHDLLSREQERRLQRVDPRSFEAGTLGTVLAGAYGGG